MALDSLRESTARPKPKGGEGAHVWNLAATVLDPEVPVLTIEDLGVLRSAEMVDGRAIVTITPTYSGCPAMDAIRDDVLTVLNGAGYADADVRLVLSPAWTTDWMSESGKAKLLEYGIAPPTGHAAMGGPVRVALSVKCPQCGSLNTTESSRFGSTACKALYTCNACHEPFDYFKVH
ncbi:MAG: 1,2-phenylacetyl-CoA epoxidase subunit PaaD [Terrimesophilobacter sp.]